MASRMEVILTTDVDNLGRAGDVVVVKPGYGRNYLLPRGFAMLATRGNVAQIEHHKRSIAAEQAKLKEEHVKLAASLKGVTVSIARQAGEQDKLFGSVTSKDVVEALAAQNINIDRKLLKMGDAIKDVGQHKVQVRFSADVNAELTVNVVAIKK